MGGAVWIIFNGSDTGWDAVLIPLEINDSVKASVPTAPVSNGNPPIGIPSAMLFDGMC